MDSIQQFLKDSGLPFEDAAPAPSSSLRFPDGGEYRIEIPSTEGPRVLAAVVEEAAKRGVPLHRISQGSGIMLLTGAEISEMASIGKKERIEVNLFIGPRASFDIGATAVAPAGKAIALSLRGSAQLSHALYDVQKACERGIRSILVSDIGSLELIANMRAKGLAPKNLVLKTSVMMAPANPASARIIEQLGADTINIPSDLTIPQIASIRSAIKAVIDFYVEAPDTIGGFIRYYEIAEIIRVAAPVYLKFGLRNSPDVYPSGTHLENSVLGLSRERVRRAEIAMEMIAKFCPEAKMSPLGAPDLGIPE